MTDRADESYRLTPEAKLRLNLRGVSLEDSIPLIRAYGDERVAEGLERVARRLGPCSCRNLSWWTCPSCRVRALKEKP